MLATAILACACSAKEIRTTIVFAQDSDSCHFYRIPAMTLDARGNIVAVVDRRYENLADLGYRSTSIDISCKRSTDEGYDIVFSRIPHKLIKKASIKAKKS